MKINFAGSTVDLKLIVLPIIYIVIGVVIFSIVKNIITKAINKKGLKITQKQRVQTLSTMIVNVIKYLIVVFVALAILSIYGINVKSIMAGLGIGTAIIGLAFQDLAKDLIAGFSGFMGEVIFIGLRTTRIRNVKGATKIVANHYMDNIINYSLNNSLAIVDVSIAYECDEDKIDEAFQQLCKKWNGKLEFATKDIEIWGVNDLTDSGVVYRIAVETKPMKQFVTERFLRKEIKKCLDAAGIKIPYTQIEVHNGK